MYFSLFYVLVYNVVIEKEKKKKAFMEPFQVSRKSVKIKIQINFYVNTTSGNAWGEEGINY